MGDNEWEEEDEGLQQRDGRGGRQRHVDRQDGGERSEIDD